MWLIVAVVGYLLNAIALLIDRALLSKAVPNPAVYTFFIAFLGMSALVLLPFGVVIPSWTILLIAFLSGLCFTGALYTMFVALKHGEASEITPFIGGIQPIFVFLLSSLFLAEVLQGQQMIGFIIILIGGFLIASNKPKYGYKTLLVAILSTIFYAFSYVLAKMIYDDPFFVDSTNAFINGFFWTRLAAFLTACLLLLQQHTREGVLAQFTGGKSKTGAFFLAGQIAGAVSFILVNYAYSLYSVTLVNGMQGVQYAFLFLMIYPLSKKYPHLWPETWQRKILIKKIISIMLIAIGLFFIAQT